MGDSVKSLAYKKVNYIRNPKGNPLAFLANQLTFIPSSTVWGGGTGVVRRETITTPDGPLPGIVREFTTAATGRIDTITVGFTAAYYGTDTIGLRVKPNTTYTLSFWVLKRANMTFQVCAQQRSTSGGAAAGELTLFSAPYSSGAWTRVEASFTTASATSTIKLMFYQASAPEYMPVGDNLTVAGMVFEEGSTATPYFDGDTPGYSWSGTPNESITVSDEKEFGDREVRVNGVKNYYPDPGCERQSGTVVVRNNFCTNPSFRNDTSDWTVEAQNVSVSSLNRVSSSDSVSGYVGRVTFTGSIAAKSPIFYTLATTSVSRYIASFYIKSSKSGNFAIRHSGENYNWTEVEADTWTRINAPFITAPTSSEFGISTDVNFVDGDTLEFGDVLVERGRALLPFFDGSYNTWESNDLVEEWVGTAGNSASRLVGMNPSGVSNGSEPKYNPCWLSTDNPYHGDYFVRCLVTNDDDYASYIDVTPTINTLVGRRVTGSVRVRTSKPIAIDVRYRGQVSVVGWNSDTIRPVGVWEEARATGVQNTNNDRWIRPWTQSVPLGNQNFGALVDVDAAMFTVGGYSGDYFDGDSPNAEWTGTPNNSVSVLKQFAPAQVRSYNGTNWVAG